MLEGSRRKDSTFMLPLRGAKLARDSPCTFILEGPESPTPGPDLGPLSFDDLSLMVVDEVRDALLDDSLPDQEDPVDLANTKISKRPLPLGMLPPRPGMAPLRPQPHGVFHLNCSIHAPTSTPVTSMDGVSEPRQDNTGHTRCSNKSQPPQREANPAGVAEVVEARPKRIIKIKSRIAVLYLRELNKREEAEANIQRVNGIARDEAPYTPHETAPFDEAEANIERRIASGDAWPPSETAQFDESVWHWDTKFEVPGDYSWFKGSH
ncbi:hypothetical protein DHEL01_v208921 [Diaporthe helianthi]|uniref:Uncharacterized protein n=1 Tax=Diaporthe helianthi TaxID=158607 RepID=A0A2P5HQZ1_DIAHE|nr:hypothetical protein DHEL01_v208921 [Diaporthe helianthi]